ncbi:hypothetical protein IKF57_01420 [Candidatus Saccharibacteria bacterium]|nr:hypothetical protein [Candidatus Saccharibacteria bacterium]
MYFDNPDDISTIAKNYGTSIFAVKDPMAVTIKNAIVIEPTTKASITIEQIRDVLARTNLKQTSDTFIIIRPAEKLSTDAEHTMLKNLEEPGENLHFVLLTTSPAKLLPTILSRAAIFYLRQNFHVDSVEAHVKIKDLAKSLISAKPATLPQIAEQISKQKSAPRDYALEVLKTAIEILYKTYLINQKSIFLNKIPKFLTAYENIAANGHIKLHLIADLC